MKNKKQIVQEQLQHQHDIIKENEENTIKLVQGDCLKLIPLIPNSSVDAIITDPPYGMNFQSNYRNEKYNKISNDNDLAWLNEFAKLCFNVSKDNTAHYIFCSFHNIDKFKQAFERYFKVKNILV